MIIRKAFFLPFLLLLLFIGCASGQKTGEDIINEIKEGNIHLTLNEKKGSFSLFYISNQQYAALFNSAEPPASYTSISVDGKVSKLGEKNFRARLVNYGGYPEFIYESSTVTVTQTFTPVKTVNSSVVNGIMVTYTVQNNAEIDYSVGLRISIDTELGERRGLVPFYLDGLEIINETLVEKDSLNKSWVSRNDNVSLMGSIANPMDNSQKTPDYIHFANWKRLYSSSWNLRYSQGRSFRTDSAVCYFYEPAVLGSGESFVYTIFLTAEDDAGLYHIIKPVIKEPEIIIEPPPITQIPLIEDTVFRFNIRDIEQSAIIQAQLTGENADVLILLKLQDILNQFINGEIDLGEKDLMDIESAINRRR